MSAAQLDGALLESQSFDEGAQTDHSYLGDREARYEFKRHLVRRLQAMTRGMARSERFRHHQMFIQEWRALQDDHEALYQLPLITGLLEGPVRVREADTVNARHTRGVKPVVIAAGSASAASADSASATHPVQLSVLTA